MVGLLMKSGCEVNEGDPLYREAEGVVPWAAALSDALLSSNCAACFAPCDPLSRFLCHGPCQGTIAYCSPSCRDLDLPLHLHSRECNLLALLQSPASPVLASPLPSHFPSLGGTCDLRAALRLLAHHQALHHVAPFLAASRNGLHDVDCARLGGLLSNRSNLLQRAALHEDDGNSEQEQEELLIATELWEAAMLIRDVVYSTSEPCVCYLPKHNECMDHDARSGHLRSFENAHGHVSAHADVCMETSSMNRSTSGDVHIHMGRSEHLDLHEITHGLLHRHMDVHMAKRGHLSTHDTTDADAAVRMAGTDCEKRHETTHEQVHNNMDVHLPTSAHLGVDETTHADTAATMAKTDDKVRHKTTHGHVHMHMDVHMSTSWHLETQETTHADTAATVARTVDKVQHKTTHGHVLTHTDARMATSWDLDTQESTHADTATRMARSHAKMCLVESMTPAEEILLAEEVICQVFTNGVCIQVDTWTKAGHLNVRQDVLGTAVYGPLFSWINHSCRPNAFYSFVLAGPATPKSSLEAPLVPDVDVKGLEDAWGLQSCSFPWLDNQGLQHYGPCACLYSIRNIKGLEPVCISYTALLQPKNTRKRELWLKYRFHCICERCDAKSTSNVDVILQNIGFWGSRGDMSTLEDWLHEEAQHGLSEFLKNDNLSSCCKILENALVRVLEAAYQNWLRDEIPQTFQSYATRIESFNLCGGKAFLGHDLYRTTSQPSMPDNEPGGALTGAQGLSRSEASQKHGMHVKVHLMHHLCLDMYMALSSSYKILSGGCNSSRYESLVVEGSAPTRCEVECSMASAAYTLVLAMTIQYLCDFGEPGLLSIAGRFWLQTGEAFVGLILELDRYYCLEDASEIHNLSRVFSDFKSILFCEKEFVCQLKNSFHAHGRLMEAIHLCDCTSDIFRCIITSLWPFLRRASQFLWYIENPFDINQVFFGSSVKQRGKLDSEEGWICRRAEAFICALCALRHGLKFMNICHGYNEELIEALQNLVNSCCQRHRPSD